MNLNNTNANDAAMKMPESPTMARAAVAAALAGSRMLGEAGYGAQQAQGPESELQYAARVATDSLVDLEHSVHELVARLQVVLSQESPSPASPPEVTRRSCSSQIANALIAHAEQTDRVTGLVRSVLRRIVL